MMILLLSAGILTACSTYKARLVLRPPQRSAGEAAAAPGVIGDGEVGIAEGIVLQLAEEHEMRRVPNPKDSSFTTPYQVLLMFRGPGFKRHVRLSAAVKQDRSEIAFAITDQEHGSETEFTATLWQRLKEETEQKLAEYVVAEEKSSMLRNPLAP